MKQDISSYVPKLLHYKYVVRDPAQKQHIELYYALKRLHENMNIDILSDC